MRPFPRQFDLVLVFLVFGVFCGRNTLDTSRARVGRQVTRLGSEAFFGEPLGPPLPKWGSQNPQCPESCARQGNALKKPLFLRARSACSLGPPQARTGE